MSHLLRLLSYCHCSFAQGLSLSINNFLLADIAILVLFRVSFDWSCCLYRELVINYLGCFCPKFIPTTKFPQNHVTLSSYCMNTQALSNNFIRWLLIVIVSNYSVWLNCSASAMVSGRGWPRVSGIMMYVSPDNVPSTPNTADGRGRHKLAWRFT